MAKKLTDDEKIFRWGKRLQSKADKLLAEGRISVVEYRDASWHALQAMRPRMSVKIVGI